MVFNFTFNFTGGLHNPFAQARKAADNAPAPPQPGVNRGAARSEQVRATREPLHQSRKRPPPSPTFPQASSSSRKRGWDPVLEEPASTNKAASYPPPSMSGHEEPAVNDLPPAPKRRRTLAGSILSTALSAALIGTAVGLTFYRLWAERGSQYDNLPPPPSYQEATRGSAQNRTASPAPSTKPTPLTPRHRKPAARRSISTRASLPRRKHHPRPSLLHVSTTPVVSPGSSAPPSSVPPEFDFGSVSQDGPVAEADMDEDDEMDFIGDRISALIAEGKRALGREVVVSSERPEDEVDDGTGDWEEDEPSFSSSTSGPSRKRGRLSLSGRPHSSSVSSRETPASPHRARYDAVSHRSVTPTIMARNPSVESSRSLRAEGSFQSPELQEMMRRARESRGIA